jgi:hypothetical protein
MRDFGNKVIKLFEKLFKDKTLSASQTQEVSQPLKIQIYN